MNYEWRIKNQGYIRIQDSYHPFILDSFMSLAVYRKSSRNIPTLARLLQAGNVIAAPTETAYGLLADATNPRAVARVVKIKGREPGKPIALLASDMKMVSRHFRLTKTERLLAKKFWPGPLTILLKPKDKFSKNIVSSTGLVGLRLPGDKWLRKLLFACGRPLTATSANLAGERTLYTATAVKKHFFKSELCYLVDGGRLKKRPVSTVAGLVGNKLLILRPGAIAKSKLRLVYQLTSAGRLNKRQQS